MWRRVYKKSGTNVLPKACQGKGGGWANDVGGRTEGEAGKAGRQRLEGYTGGMGIGGLGLSVYVGVNLSVFLRPEHYTPMALRMSSALLTLSSVLTSCQKRGIGEGSPGWLASQRDPQRRTNAMKSSPGRPPASSGKGCSEAPAAA